MQNKSDDRPAYAMHPLAWVGPPDLSAAVLVFTPEHGALAEKTRQEGKRQVGLEQYGEGTKQAVAIAVLLHRGAAAGRLC